MQNYFYDLHDQLVKAEIFKKDGSKETWAYTYDALGRRIGKGRLKNEEVSDGLEEETGFVWDGSHLLQEVHPDGRYTYLYTDPDSYEPLAQVRNWTTEDGESRQQIHYFHCDQIGIPREMTDKDGNLVWFGDYYGWGKLKSETNVTGTTHQPFRLQNQYCDRETGLHYNFFRYYEPNIGRFVNQDPIGLEGGFNVYQFAPNVKGWVDPLGLFGFAGTIPSSGGFGSSVATTGHQHAAAANNAAAAIVASRSKSHTAVGRCNKDEQDPCSQFPTKNAARTIALKEAGIPTSSTPIAQNIIPNWEQYMYKNPNGSRTPLIVSHHPSDANHPCPHWHVGTAKMDGNLVQKRKNGNGTFSWKYYKDNVTVQHRK
ncbi:RHS repeat domain-containing protein [Neisseria polysaccharea]|nr:RHS repeat-associated core domain-containing protein [Neisseria polysaccharea]